MSYCPDHTLSYWRVDLAFEGSGTLGIVTDWDGMAVWELGLRPEDDGFRTMKELADSLCGVHNRQLEASGKPARGEGESVEFGFASDFSGSHWSVESVSPDGGPRVPGVRAAGGDPAAVLGTAAGLPSNSDMSMAAQRIADLHNALLNAGSTREA